MYSFLLCAVLFLEVFPTAAVGNESIPQGESSSKPSYEHTGIEGYRKVVDPADLTNEGVTAKEKATLEETGNLFHEDFAYDEPISIAEDESGTSSALYDPLPLPNSGGLFSGLNYTPMNDANGWNISANLPNAHLPKIADGRAKVSYVSGTANGGHSMINIWFRGDRSGIPQSDTYKTAYQMDVYAVPRGNGETGARTLSLNLSYGKNRYIRPVRMNLFENISGTNIFNEGRVWKAYSSYDNVTADYVPSTVTIIPSFEPNSNTGSYKVYVNGILVATPQGFALRYATDTLPEIGMLSIYNDGAQQVDLYLDAVRVFRVAEGEQVVPGNFIVKELSGESGWNGNTYTAIFPAYAFDNKDYNVHLITAAYKGEGGALSAIGIKPVKILQKGTGDDIISASLTVGDKTDSTVVKAFFWDSVAGMKPIVNQN